MGIRVPANTGANGNAVLGMMFQQLGSKHSAAGFGYAAVDLVNSSDNYIQFNQFQQNENLGGERGLIHGVYLAHGSKRNVVAMNRFSYITGGPVHVRNESDDNEIIGNTFLRTGSGAAYYDWFCDSRCVRANPGQARECPSRGNVFRDNDVISRYSGGTLGTWAARSQGSYTGPGCDSKWRPRVRTSGNT
jgi:hypothetical protein